MKKLLLIICLCLIFAGCKKFDADSALKKFNDKIENNEAYTLEGTMEIVSNEEKYLYDVEVSYKEGDYYKVSLVNAENSHEQIILKNEDGVYVITPALNKSFKFQSEWPNNSSQTYILQSILNDLKNDSKRSFEEKNDKYIFTSKVNYPSNSNLVNQKVTFNDKMELEKVEVFNSDNIAQITFVVNDSNYKSEFEKDYFSLDNNVDEDCCEEDEATSEIEDVIYPMYIPSGTTFKDEEVIKTDSSERVILTFTGEKPFIMIEEVASVSEDHEVINSSGDLVFYENILGSITDTSLNWTKNGIDYYIIGQNLTEEEILQIAASASSVALTK